jgi:hypothetical protein
VHFYELHEGDGDIFFDLLLFREEEMDPEEFFTLVQSVRHQVQGSYETESMIEAIAVELERSHGFVFISDDRLTAAVNVSKVEDDNFLADLEGEDYDDDEEDPESVDYRAVYAEFDPDGGSLN